MIQRSFVREPRPGDRIRGDVRLPDGAPPTTAVVVAHGFKGFKDWGFFPHLCRSLAAAGHAVVSFNFSRNGIGDDPEVFSELDRFGTNTYTLELEELLSILRETLDGTLLPQAPRRVGLVGHSRGGGQAVLAAAEEPRVASLVTWAAVSRLDRWEPSAVEEWRREGRIWVVNGRTGQRMPLDVTLLDDFEANRARFDVEAAARRVEAPWLVVHGREDETVSFEEAEVLARAGRDAQLVPVEGAGHTFGVGHPFAASAPALDRAVDATAAHLGRTLSPDRAPPTAP